MPVVPGLVALLLVALLLVALLLVVPGLVVLLLVAEELLPAEPTINLGVGFPEYGTVLLLSVPSSFFIK